MPASADELENFYIEFSNIVPFESTFYNQNLNNMIEMSENMQNPRPVLDVIEAYRNKDRNTYINSMRNLADAMRQLRIRPPPIPLRTYRLNQPIPENIVPPESLRFFKFSTECPVCMEEFKQNDILALAKCGHLFHKNCLINRYYAKIFYLDRCPLCRKVFFGKIKKSRKKYKII